MTNLVEIPLPSLDSLRSLQRNVQSTLRLTGNCPGGKQQHSRSDYSFLIPSLNLPHPEDVHHACKDLTFSPQILTELNKIYQDGLQQIQRIHRAKFEQSCQDLCRVPRSSDAYSLPLLMDNLRKVYEVTYTKRYLPMMRNQILSLRSQHIPNHWSKKVPFNVESIPLLEKYFEFNAYPSAPDRQVLAQKTTMTPRQIEVWFQNHRKRAKENGKVIKRLPPNITGNFFPLLERLAMSTDSKRCLPHVQSDLPHATEGNLSDGNEALPSAMEIPYLVTDSSRPSHVFPTPFSSSTTNSTTFTFPSTVWPRKPSSRTISQSEINITDLVSMFAAFNIRSGATKHDIKPRQSSHSGTQNPWYFATTTIPSPAPLPALIRSPQRSAPLPINVSATLSSLSSSQSMSTTSSSPSNKRARSLKKVAPFPKRNPSKYYPYPRNSPLTSEIPSREASSTSTNLSSRSSSLSSVDSSPPASPIFQPHNEPFIFDNQTFYLLDEFDRIYAQNSSACDIHTSTQDSDSFSSLPHPVSYVQAQS